MILFTSAIFIVMTYGLFGFQLLWILARELAPRVPFAEHMVYLALSALFWLLILGILRVGRFLFKGLYLDREGLGYSLKPFLQVNGCKWLTFLGSGLCLGAGIYLSVTAHMPFTHWPMVAVCWLIFFDGFKRPSLPGFREFLPQPRFEFDEEPEGGGQILKRLFQWDFHPEPESRTSHRLECEIRDEIYRQAFARERYPVRPVREYCRYVREGAVMELQEIAHWFRLRTEEHRYHPVQEALNVVGMVRSIAYERDEKTHEVEDYADFPVELLVEERGDCEDHAILAACILWILGHDVALIHMEGSEMGHLALGYHKQGLAGAFSIQQGGKQYYYLETVPCSTDDGVGDVAEKFVSSMPKHEVCPI